MIKPCLQFYGSTLVQYPTLPWLLRNPLIYNRSHTNTKLAANKPTTTNVRIPANSATFSLDTFVGGRGLLRHSLVLADLYLWCMMYSVWLAYSTAASQIWEEEQNNVCYVAGLLLGATIPTKHLTVVTSKCLTMYFQLKYRFFRIMLLGHFRQNVI